MGIEKNIKSIHEANRSEVVVFLMFTVDGPSLLVAEVIKFHPQSLCASRQGAELLRNVCWDKLKESSPLTEFRRTQVAPLDAPPSSPNAHL